VWTILTCTFWRSFNCLDLQNWIYFYWKHSQALSCDLFRCLCFFYSIRIFDFFLMLSGIAVYLVLSHLLKNKILHNYHNLVFICYHTSVLCFWIDNVLCSSSGFSCPVDSDCPPLHVDGWWATLVQGQGSHIGCLVTGTTDVLLPLNCHFLGRIKNNHLIISIIWSFQPKSVNVYFFCLKITMMYQNSTSL